MSAIADVIKAARDVVRLSEKTGTCWREVPGDAVSELESALALYDDDDASWMGSSEPGEGEEDREIASLSIEFRAAFKLESGLVHGTAYDIPGAGIVSVCHRDAASARRALMASVLDALATATRNGSIGKVETATAPPGRRH